jgi:hypothetical protein
MKKRINNVNVFESVEQRELQLKESTLRLVEYYKLRPKHYASYGFTPYMANVMNSNLKNRPEKLTVQNCWAVEEIVKQIKIEAKK